MRTIKFRGKTFSGLVVHGEYGEDRTFDGEIVGTTITTFPSPKKSPRLYKVKPNSVAQLIGCDKNGREVYEGDEVKPARAVDNSLNFRATMYDMRALDEGKIILVEKLP